MHLTEVAWVQHHWLGWMLTRSAGLCYRFAAIYIAVAAPNLVGVPSGRSIIKESGSKFHGGLFGKRRRHRALVLVAAGYLSILLIDTSFGCVNE